MTTDNKAKGDVMREFEAWHDSLFEVSAASCVKSDYGYPQNSHVQQRWHTWQAAAKHYSTVACGWQPPHEATNEMIIAALEASLQFRKERGLDDIQPDTPGGVPAEMVRVVYKAMLPYLHPTPLPAQDEELWIKEVKEGRAAVIPIGPHRLKDDDGIAETFTTRVRAFPEGVEVTAQRNYHEGLMYQKPESYRLAIRRIDTHKEYLRPTPPQVDRWFLVKTLHDVASQYEPRCSDYLIQRFADRLQHELKAQGLTEGGKAPDLAALEALKLALKNNDTGDKYNDYDGLYFDIEAVIKTYASTALPKVDIGALEVVREWMVKVQSDSEFKNLSLENQIRVKKSEQALEAIRQHAAQGGE